MLAELTVENLAIIERSQLTLGPGFTVLTGETGAGKSLLVDAIELALGDRADSELVRMGAARASVAAVFDLSGSPELRARCADLGVELEDGSLYIQREVFAEGRSQCRVSGRMTPVATLRQLGQLLVDLHGQHDHQSLLDPRSHLSHLDAWIGEPARVLQLQVAEAHRAAESARQRFHALRQSLRDREQRLDLLRFQVAEIEGAAPRVGEIDERENQLSRLKNVESLSTATFGALAAVADADANALDQLRAAVKALDGVAQFDEKVDQLATPLRDSLFALQDGAEGLRAYAEELDTDPSAIEEAASRIDTLKRLRRKYGEDEARVLEYLEQIRGELGMLENSEAGEQELADRAAEAESRYQELGEQLSSLRQEKAEEFGAQVRGQLRDLAMERAEFAVALSARQPPDETGLDDAQFQFSANAGEAMRPLSKIASGGEISRVMLAMKTALAGRAGVPTLIFDEVDAGLGGRAAAVVGKKLEELAAHHQVVVISHLPQIASRATSHCRIEKVVADGRAVTQVRALSADERVEEIARMLAGESVTESALANARDMLA